ncbi:hypothetical protein [Leifsonia sp. 71-9]|uniref:hypothetical protein n=1 Tax=Leifsonia sp. 71-9 TaxID=1895934 RepID=UPI00092A833F|nr:hypothetical protein [Leifsonia sp. 71-9]OJX73107.1 MAG: hypothetical protein BGO91_15330 [Leifsonia sp. 71-9]
MTDAWSEWEQRLAHIAAAVELWSGRTKTAPVVPAGSALSGDDRPALSVSSIAWYPLIIAVEHLDFALSTMRATQTMYPTSYMTTLRTALLTASQAAWVLAPVQRAERRGRAMRLRMQDLDDQLKLVNSASELTKGQERARTHDVEELNKQLEECRHTAATLGLPKSSTAKLNNTDIITEAAKQLHDDPVAASGVQLLWRTGSAAAHGQRAYALMRMNTNVVENDGERRVMQLRGDLVHDVGPAVAAATLAANEAFRLFDLRCGHAPESIGQLQRIIDLLPGRS